MTDELNRRFGHSVRPPVSGDSFLHAEAWMAGVEHALRGPDGARLLAFHSLPIDLVLTVAQCDACSADSSGITRAHLTELAERTGVSRRQAAKARLVLVEAKLESLDPHPSEHGATHRVLNRSPHDDAD